MGTPSLFRVLGISPVLGRSFTDDEGEIGAEQKELRINGRPYIIVGVMPAGFKGR